MPDDPEDDAFQRSLRPDFVGQYAKELRGAALVLGMAVGALVGDGDGKVMLGCAGFFAACAWLVTSRVPPKE